MTSRPVGVPQAKYEPRLPGDKSISHRVLLMSALAEGVSRIKNLSESEDVLATLEILKALGVKIWKENQVTMVEGVGFSGFKKPTGVLNAKNSGTTARHMLGLLAFANFDSALVGDESLSQRPMRRVSEPLQTLGAQIKLATNGSLPANISASVVTGESFKYEMPIASGQIKSSLLMACAQNGVELTLTGKLDGRDHTENLIRYYGGRIIVSPEQVVLPRQNSWKAIDWTVPADISAAAFWIAKTLLEKDSELVVTNVGINPTRMGFVRALRSMGANISYVHEKETPEQVGTIRVASSNLRAIEVSEVTSFIDEVPLLALLCTQAQGTSRITGARELKHKESDRLRTTKEALESLGLVITSLDDGFEIEGPQKIKSGTVDPHGDHRIAMLGLVAKHGRNLDIKVLNTDCASVSDPLFVSQISETPISEGLL